MYKKASVTHTTKRHTIQLELVRDQNKNDQCRKIKKTKPKRDYYGKFFQPYKYQRKAIAIEKQL